MKFRLLGGLVELEGENAPYVAALFIMAMTVIACVMVLS